MRCNGQQAEPPGAACLHVGDAKTRMVLDTLSVPFFALGVTFSNNGRHPDWKEMVLERLKCCQDDGNLDGESVRTGDTFV